MDLLKWMGVGGSSQAATASTSGAKVLGGKPINHADYKQFGLENFGNTCYANSVLQALYFCQPFRELVCESYDSSNPPIPQVTVFPPVNTLAPAPTRPGGGLKAFRRRDSALDTNKVNDDSQVNGHATERGLSSTIPAAPPTLFSALRSLFLHIALNPSDKGKISPTTFIEKVKVENPDYRSTMHQDAHEFLGFLLNKIVEDLHAESKKASEGGAQDLSSSLGSLSSASPLSNSSSSQRQLSTAKTFVHTLFEGNLTSETRCLSCETVSSRDESFLDLSIDIEQNSSVTACLRQFSASEMLSRKNKFFCDCCGSLQEAEKRMKIKKLPNILALHLKRFKYQEDLQRYIKLSYRVAFPFELRLFNTVDDAPDPDRLYQLFAIVVHIGNGPNHGHYICIARAHGSWYVFDDDNVDPIRESDIPKYFGESQHGAGYVLFYQATDLEGLAPTGGFTSEENATAVDVDGKMSIDVTISLNGVPTSVPAEGSSPDVAIVVQDEPANHIPPERPIPTKLMIPGPTEPNPNVDTPMQTVSAVALSSNDKSISASSAARSSASILNGFSETATISSDSSVGPPGLFVQTAETSSLATTQASLSTSSGGFLSRTLKHSQSAKAIGRDKDKDKRRAASSGADGGSNNNGDIPLVPPLPVLTHSKSFKGENPSSWFSSKRKSGREKERPEIPPLPTPTANLAESATSPLSSVGCPESMLSVLGDDLEDTGATSGSPSGQVTTIPPASPTSPASSTVGKLKGKQVTRPSTAPSSATNSRMDEPLPPLPSSPRQRKSSQSQPFTPSSMLSAHVFPSSPIPPSPSRKASQNLSPVPLSPSAPSPLTERSPMASIGKPKRASRKMSVTGMSSLTAMFGRRDKDKERNSDKDAGKTSMILRRPSLVASGNS